MQKDKLKELITQYISEILDEEVGGNVSANAGGYLGKFAFKKPVKQKAINEVRYSQFKTQTKSYNESSR